MSDIMIQEENPLNRFNTRQIDAIRNTVAKNATDDELYMFLSVCGRYGLDPFLKEAWFTQIKGQNQIMVGRDGYVKAARNTTNFEKLVSNAVFEHDEFEIIWDGMNQTIHHKHAANDRGKIIGAWAGLKFTNKDPTYVYVAYNEYAKDNTIWRKHKSAMIRKVAEKEVCRICCGITGIYTEEEMPEEYSLEESQKNDDAVDVEFTAQATDEYSEPETNVNYDEPSFTTADDIEPVELDPISLNYCRTIKARLEENNEPVNKSTMRRCLVKMIKANEIDKSLRPSLIKFINQHCPEDLE